MSSDSDDIPSDVEEAAQSAISSIIPNKSKAKYDLAYEKLEKWCEGKNIKHINEKILLAYFEGKKTLKASTLWTLYSMLRSELSLKRNIDIKKYTNLVAFLKRQSDGYHAKKSNVLSKQNIAKFLIEADDKTFLMAKVNSNRTINCLHTYYYYLSFKVAMIVGIAGACRKSELTFLHVEDIVDNQSYFRVNIPNTKTKVIREFVITKGNIDGVNFLDIIKKYINLRPPNVKHNRFFVKYNNGKCSIQPVGINTIGNLPKMIAKHIGLPDCVSFTGHCFRRTSATWLADSGADTMKIKRHGGWKSNSVAEGYVEDSLENKKKIATDILGETSNCVSQISANSTTTSLSSSGVNISNCKNCVINIYKN
jgi:integrase